MKGSAKSFPYDSLHKVSMHSVANFFGNTHPYSSIPLLTLFNVSQQKLSTNFESIRPQTRKIFFFQKPGGLWKFPGNHYFEPVETVNSARPFLRRALITFLPPTVDILSKNP